jgi:flagellar assembly protein FliH
MATIIRKDSGRQLFSGVVPGTVAFSFVDMRGQADDYLQAVQEEAAKIVQQAHQQAEQIRRRAEAAGRQAAVAAAERDLDEKVAHRMGTVLPALQQLVQQINDARGEMQNHWERSAIRVATAIAERIIRRQIERQPQITLDLIAETLRLATGSAKITLRLNPTDYENMGSQAALLTEGLCQLSPSAVVADPAISAGGCRVDTEFGEIDQQIETQLRRIEQELEC